MSNKNISPQQELFCQEYVALSHVTNAAKAAGYSEKTAHVQGSVLLKQLKIQKRVRELRDEAMGEVNITVKRLVAELASMATSNLYDYVGCDGHSVTVHDFKELSRADMAAVKSVREVHTKDAMTLEIRLYDKHKSIELLGKYLGMFNDMLKLDSDRPLQIQIVEVAGDNDGSG